MLRRRFALPAVVLLAAAAAASPPGIGVSLELTAGGLDRPISMAHAGDGSGRLFVVEQEGRVRIVRAGELVAEPFLDLSERVRCCSERGLLGLAFHPSFASNGLFYVHYSDLAGDTVVSELSVSADDPDLADAGSERVLLAVEQPFQNHNGGQLAFGPDGYLYIALGDGGSGGDPLDSGQSLDTLLGKLLRIDVDRTDAGLAYGIPNTNPFVDDPEAQAEIWAYGLRNPWRFSFDRETGDLWIGDVGQNAFEEIDFEAAGGPGGVNYGWNRMEGRSCFDPPSDCDDGSLALPVFDYAHDGSASVTGGYRYRGPGSPQWRGVYFFSDFALGTVWASVPRCDGDFEFRAALDSGFSVSSFGEDEAGELYLFDYSFSPNASELYRLTPLAGAGPELGFAPARLDFGGIAIGESSSLDLVVENVNAGPESVSVDEVAVGGSRFTLDLDAGAQPCGETPCLPPGSSCSLALRFDAVDEGIFVTELSFDANSPTRTVPVSAFSAEPCALDEVVTLADRTIDTAESIAACGRIEVGPAVTVAAGGDLELRAGGRVVLGDGLRVDPGGGLTALDDPLLTID